MTTSSPPGELVLYDIISPRDDVTPITYRSMRPIDAIYGVIREMSDPDTVR